MARVRVRLKVRVKSEDAKDRLENIQDRTQDLGPVLRWAKSHLERAYEENFLSQGAVSARAMMAGGWAPLSPAYGAWKASHWPTPLMVRTGKLLFDVTHLETDGAKSDTSITFNVRSSIAQYHQYGTSEMPARKLVFVPRDFDRDIGKKTTSYVVNGSKIA